jgi:transposase-like protein
VAEGALALFAACRRMLDEHKLTWSPDFTLAAVECACSNTGKVDAAAAVHTIRQYHAWVRAERATLN